MSVKYMTTLWIIATSLGLLAAPALGQRVHPASAALAPLPPSPQVTLSGYAVRMGETILLFDSKASADAFDVARCRNIGADADLFARLSRSANRNVQVNTVGMGTHYAEMTQSQFALWRIRGRRIEIHCLDNNLYWARRFRVIE